MRIAIYPGTFDPFTNGHLDILERSSQLFDQVVVGVALETEKNTLFDVEARLDFIRSSIEESGLSNVEVVSFGGLLMHFAESRGATAIIRGLRAVSDFEYEFQMALMNRNLNPEVETVFLMTSSDYAFLSSSTIKSVVRLGGSVRGLVPQQVEDALKKLYGRDGK